VLYYLVLSGNFKARKFGMEFFWGNFWSRDFLGFVGDPRDFLGFDFPPVRSSSTLEIWSIPPPPPPPCGGRELPSSSHLNGHTLGFYPQTLLNVTTTLYRRINSTERKALPDSQNFELPQFSGEEKPRERTSRRLSVERSHCNFVYSVASFNI